MELFQHPQPEPAEHQSPLAWGRGERVGWAERKPTLPSARTFVPEHCICHYHEASSYQTDKLCCLCCPDKETEAQAGGR